MIFFQLNVQFRKNIDIWPWNTMLATSSGHLLFLEILHLIAMEADTRIVF